MEELKEKVRVFGGAVYAIDRIEPVIDGLRITFADNVSMEGVAANMAAFKEITILTRSDDVCGEYSGYDSITQMTGRTVTFTNGGAV